MSHNGAEIASATFEISGVFTPLFKTTRLHESSFTSVTGTPKKKEERLSRHLIQEDMTEKINHAILNDAKKYITNRTLIVTDPTDLQKRYAKKMEGLSKVYDGTKGDVGDNLGYSGVAIVACNPESREMMPLHLSFWSGREEGFKSDTDKVYGAIRNVIGRKGIHVFDRNCSGVRPH